ncbi:hypothetical protein [Frankia tisae]|uniref:hypothetical protein n=1 Tax=Frankia tisae TaxID=2950104 RepID=UPI0021C12087|nr:hypothetical protein [Frankia tisae]
MAASPAFALVARVRVVGLVLVRRRVVAGASADGASADGAAPSPETDADTEESAVSLVMLGAAVATAPSGADPSGCSEGGPAARPAALRRRGAGRVASDSVWVVRSSSGTG